VTAGALVEEVLRLPQLLIRDRKGHGRWGGGGALPSHGSLLHLHAGSVTVAAGRGARRPEGLRAATGEDRREVGVAERVEVGGVELHRPRQLARNLPPGREPRRRRRKPRRGARERQEANGGRLIGKS
jgi:hypothetical protein